MKKHLIIIPILLISLSIALAQEQPKYNFGSMQPVKELTIAPGDTVTTKLYFYNIYGNRITHISLFASEAPEDWDISFNPSLHETSVRVSGIETEIEENIYVEPSEAVEEIPEDIPEGIEYISSSVGYIGAKPIEITISVPEDEELGSTHDITISASAEWLGQSGAVEIKQSRDFDLAVKVLSKEFKEEILTTTTTEPEAEEEISSPLSAITGQLILTYTLFGIIIVVVVVVAYLSFLFGRKRRGEI